MSWRYHSAVGLWSPEQYCYAGREIPTNYQPRTRGERDSIKLEFRSELWSDHSLPLVGFSLPFITKHGMWFASFCSSPPRIPNPQHVEHQNCGRSFEARKASFSILKPSDPRIGHFRILVWLPFHLVHRIALSTVFNPPSSMLTPFENSGSAAALAGAGRPRAGNHANATIDRRGSVAEDRETPRHATFEQPPCSSPW